MKAMILAAGRGERMRPLTEHTPKPLLHVGGKTLIEYHLEKIAAVGIADVIINIAYLGEQIRDYVGDGSSWQLAVQYSVEREPLETAGAILHALPLLGDQPFLLINGDVWTDYPLENLMHHDLQQDCGHLILVSNPAHHPEGDFSVVDNRLREKNNPSYTFSGISLLSPGLITDYPHCRDRFPLGEVFRHFLSVGKVSADIYSGEWWDVGTVERLKQLDQRIINDDRR